MSDHERRRSVSRERSPAGDRERRHDDAKTDRLPEEPPKQEFKCFVGGIPWHVNDSALREIFAEFNPTDAAVMLEKHSHRSRGFGFVWFADEPSREAAIDKHHGTEIEGRKVSVTKAVPQSQTAPGTPADALRRGQTVPRDHGRVRRDGGGGGRDRRYGSGGGGGGYRRDSRDRDDYRGRDSYRDSYDRDRSYRGSGGGDGYDRGYDRGYGGGGGGGGYRPGYGYERGSYDTYERGYGRSYDDRRPAYGGGSETYYEPYVPRDPYAARPPPSRYEPAAPPSYYNSGGGAGGGGGDSRYAAPPPPQDGYGYDR